MTDKELYLGMLGRAQVETEFYEIADGTYIYEGETYTVDLVIVATHVSGVFNVSFFKKDGSFITSDIINLAQDSDGSGRSKNGKILPRYAVQSGRA